MVVKVVLVADVPDAGSTTVATTLEVNVADPRWPVWLVDAVTTQAREGARRLRDELYEQRALPETDGFVPLAAVVPSVSRQR
jgi:hypothetical protein